MPNEESLSPQDESLPEANHVDPNGPPRPAQGPNWVGGVITTVGCLAVGGVLFSMCGLTPARTMGSTRSSKLKWEERDRQIDEAIQKDQNTAVDVNSSASLGKDAA
jgi:hypothetical protein